MQIAENIFPSKSVKVLSLMWLHIMKVQGVFMSETDFLKEQLKL